MKREPQEKNTDKIDLETGQEVTWCPGCTNFLVKEALKQAILELSLKKEKVILVTDIGCSSKIHNYLNVTSIDGLHGRALPIAFGVCVASKKKGKDVKIVIIAGDGGAYNEGISHLIHMCRYNPDVKYFVMNNQVFALTVGQATSITEQGFVEKTHPYGVKEMPLNPIVLALESGASFVARANSLNLQQTKEIFKQAITHKGFAFVDILQPCISFHDTRDILKDTYTIEPMSLNKALEVAREWDYQTRGKIAVGIFYRQDKKTFYEKYRVN